MTDKPPVEIYVNRIQNKVTFNNKYEYYLEHLTRKTMKLLVGNQQKIAKDKNGDNVLRLEITDMILVHCNIFHNHCQNDSRVLSTFFTNKSFS